MDTLQKELKAAYPALRIQFLGVNEQGQESGNPSMTAGRALPLLQDVDANTNSKSDVWYDRWNVAFRDVVILDGSNDKVGVYNVTVHNLATPENYATLREMLVDAAMANQKPWRNPGNPLDADNDQSVVALDALVIINRLNATGPQELPPPTTSQLAPPFYDCSGDNQITAQDALQVINYLNGNTAGAGEGEGDASASASAAQIQAILAVESPWPVFATPSREARNVASWPAELRNDDPLRASDAAWESGVDLAFAATASGSEESAVGLPMEQAPCSLPSPDELFSPSEEIVRPV